MKYLYILFVVLLSLIPSHIMADTIQTTSGELLEGNIIQDNQDGIILQTKYGQINLPQSKITKIIYESQVPGNKYFQEKQYDKAIAEYQKAIDQNPQNKETAAKLTYQIGLCQYELQDYSQAIETFKKLLTDYPETTIADKTMFQIAQCHSKQGDKTIAISKYRQLVQKFPKSPLSGDALYEIGLLYEEANNPDSASEAYQRLLNKYPKSAKLSLAKEHIEQIEFNKQVPELLVHAKARFTEINQMKWDYKNITLYDEVLNTLGLIVKREEFNIELALEAQKLMLDIYERQAEYKKADTNFSKFVTLYEKKCGVDKTVWLIVRKADGHFNDKFIQRAVPLYQMIIENYPNSEWIDYAYYKLGCCYTELHNFNAAIDELQNAIDKYPESRWGKVSYYALGHVYWKIKNFQLAIENFRKLIQIYPERPYVDNAQYFIGKLCLLNRDYVNAKVELEKLLRYYPNSDRIDDAQDDLNAIKKLEEQ